MSAHAASDTTASEAVSPSGRLSTGCTKCHRDSRAMYCDAERNGAIICGRNGTNTKDPVTSPATVSFTTAWRSRRTAHTSAMA